MNFYSSLEVIFYLKRNKYFILLGGICFAVVVLFMNYFSPKFYEANVIVYNTNKFSNEVVTGKTNQSIQEIDDAYTIINWVYSSELINYLLENFDLYNHYKIDTSKDSHYTLAFNQLSDNISVSTTSYNAVKITVKDMDRIMSAEIANEIVKKVDALNESLVIAKRKQIIQVYDVLLEELSEECNKQKDSIGLMTEKLSAVIGRMKQSSISSGKIESLENSLLKAGFNFEKSANDWLNTKKSHLMSLKYIEKFNLPSFVIVRHALPEIPASPYSMANVGFLLLAFLFGGWVVIVFLVVKYKYAHYLKYIFKSETEIKEEYKEIQTTGKIYRIGDAKFHTKVSSENESEEEKKKSSNFPRESDAAH